MTSLINLAKRLGTNTGFLRPCSNYGVVRTNENLEFTNMGQFLLTFIRTKIRCYFPKPKEVKRIKVHGWNKRMSTLEGRRVIMRRILKGRHVLTH